MSSIRVKFVGRGGLDPSGQMWARQISGGRFIGDLEFIFDPNVQSYDWFVVYDDMPRLDPIKRIHHFERLSCPPENTILITSEPSSVRRYPRLFLNQFNYILSSQEPEFLAHEGHIRQQCGLRWYYGIGGKKLLTLDDMIARPPLKKSAMVSTITSSKKQNHTLHARRIEFVEALISFLPEIERFGHGVRLIDDKAEALDDYRYHIAIENHIAPHHWTEKLSDAFLACTLPFYIGAPNVYDYFPKDSLILLSLDDPKGSAQRIHDAIANQEWEKRLPSILQARQLIIERYGLFQNLASSIENLRASPVPFHHSNVSGLIESANDARMRRPVFSFLERITNAKRFLV